MLFSILHAAYLPGFGGCCCLHWVRFGSLGNCASNFLGREPISRESIRECGEGMGVLGFGSTHVPA